ncbi:recombinase family protein [Geobacter sp.]|uniref:recombinase family protein n=1 Tax=Geobacter sp. TaxID=46610 RepID=UPI0026124534|nr:recombinase family protein [Geobacter sp.]
MAIHKHPTKPEIAAAIYIRKSREDKSKPAHRLTVQREQLPAYARAQGWSFEVYDDGHASAARGKTEDLRERARLERDIRAGKIGIILVIELSRLSRDDSLQDYVAWLHLCAEHGVRLATLTRTLNPAQPSDWMLLLMEGGFSSVEMKVLKSRMEEGRAEAFRSGRYLGGQVPPPYVYDPALKRPVIDPAALERLRQVWTLAEQMSARAVAVQLGLPHIAIRRAIADDRLLYCQALRLDPDTGEQIPCEWEPCLDAERAERIRANRRNGISGYSRRHAAGLLSNLGIFTCGYCGRSVRAWKNGRPRKDGSRLDYYGCKANETRRLCEKSRMVPQQIIDERVATNLCNTLAAGDDLKRYWFAAQDNDDTTARIAELERQTATLQEKKQRLVAAITEGVIGFADAKAKRAELDASIEDLRRQLATARASIQTEPDWDSLALTREGFDAMEFDEQREIIALAITGIRLYAGYMIIDYAFPRAETGDTSTRIHLPPPARGPAVKRTPRYKTNE